MVSLSLFAGLYMYNVLCMFVMYDIRKFTMRQVFSIRIWCFESNILKGIWNYVVATDEKERYDKETFIMLLGAHINLRSLFIKKKKTFFINK